MKKIILTIISLSIIFSSTFNTFAEEGYIEQLLDLNYGVEEYTINLNNLDNISFNNVEYTIMHRNLKDITNGLKSGFMTQYRNGEYGFYQMNGIVTNYNNFIYHSNKYFLFLRIKEQNNNYGEVDSAILKSYKNMRNSYSNMKNIVRGY